MTDSSNHDEDNLRRSGLRPEIDRIIDSGRAAGAAAVPARSVFGVTAATGVLLWLSFAPMEIAAAAWPALVPVCQLLRLRSLPKRAFPAAGVAGFLWALVTLQWMRLGHVAMYGALAALAFNLSLYFPVFIAGGRLIRRTRLPLWLVVPLVWTSLEFLRAFLLTGFSWYYLGHSQFAWIDLIQISDLTGAYGVSFLVAMSSGALAEFVPAAWLVRLRLAATAAEVDSVGFRTKSAGVLLTAGLVIACCVYGRGQQPSAEPSANSAGETIPAGPVVAVAQGNFTPEVKHDPEQWYRMVREHDLLSRRAAGLRPELIVWPETMFPVHNQVVEDGVSDNDLIAFLPMMGSGSNSEEARLMIERRRSGYARELLANRSQEAGAAMLVGVLTEVARKNSLVLFNSAAFIRPDLGYVGRYDKIHRVIFGEYIPLRSVLPWLAKLTPWGAGFGIEAGDRVRVFEYNGVRYAPLICFEDTVPQLVRRIVTTQGNDGRLPDVLVNLTNDGWFRGSAELDQHLITSVFRCVETRRPMVRAVNAGISAFIDSSGRIRMPEHFLIMDGEAAAVMPDWKTAGSMIDPATGRRYRQCSAVLCGQVPLDGRETLYLRFGDWFGMLCVSVSLIATVAGWRRSNAGEPQR
ncbi:MAG: apolipoprotein N-acyltransferase [Planctomycetaceae bacterium]|nr:apolipoprotein N-acyltransferase [Planctomycetaceae bacterium]